MKNLTMAGVALAALMAGGCASTMDDDMGFAAWDMDRNGMLDANEFRAGFATEGSWNEWDRNRDGFLDMNEFGMEAGAWGIGANEFGVWDRNRDGFLDMNEFGFGSFGAWDTDRDGFINDNEFGIGFDSWFG